MPKKLVTQFKEQQNTYDKYDLSPPRTSNSKKSVKKKKSGAVVRKTP